MNGKNRHGKQVDTERNRARSRANKEKVTHMDEHEDKKGKTGVRILKTVKEDFLDAYREFTGGSAPIFEEAVEVLLKNEAKRLRAEAQRMRAAG